jgi:hypothetical protein
LFLALDAGSIFKEGISIGVSSDLKVHPLVPEDPRS